MYLYILFTLSIPFVQCPVLIHPSIPVAAIYKQLTAVKKTWKKDFSRRDGGDDVGATPENVTSRFTRNVKTAEGT